jgi:peptidoglycan/LPS O-acetylase OafA/YrhL
VLLVPTNLTYLGIVKGQDHTLFEDVAAFDILAFVLFAGWYPLSKLLTWSPVRTLGKISFSLYALHYPIIWSLKTFVARHIVPQQTLLAYSTISGLLLLPIVLGLSIAAAWLSYTYIEDPINNFGRAISRSFRTKRFLPVAAEAGEEPPSAGYL